MLHIALVFVPKPVTLATSLTYNKAQQFILKHNDIMWGKAELLVYLCFLISLPHWVSPTPGTIKMLRVSLTHQTILNPQTP